MGFRQGVRELLSGFKISCLMCVGWILVFVAQIFLPGHLLDFALVPRDLFGLIGIVTSPLLHADVSHLLGNLSALVVVLAVLFSDERYEARSALATIWIGSGVGTWLIGRPPGHLGASGVLFGIVAYLIASSIFIRSWRAAGFAIFVTFQYIAIFNSVFPTLKWISWEGHMSGALVGLWAAFALLSEASPKAKWLGLSGTGVLLSCAYLAWVAFPEGSGPKAWFSTLAATDGEAEDGAGASVGLEGGTVVDEDYRFRIVIPEGWKPATRSERPTDIMTLNASGVTVLLVSEPTLTGADDALARLAPPYDDLEVLEARVLAFQGRPAVRGLWSGRLQGAPVAAACLSYEQDGHWLALWAVTNSGERARTTLDTLLAAFEALDGPVSLRRRPVQRFEASGPGWHVKDERVVHAVAGFRLDLTDDWRALTPFEFRSPDQNAVFGLCDRSGRQYVLFLVAHASSSGVSARERARARVTDIPRDTDRHQASLDDRSLELAVWRDEPFEEAVGGVWDGRHGLWIRSWWSNKPREEALAELDSLLRRVHVMTEKERFETRSGLHQQAPFDAAVGPGWSLRDGTLVDHRVGVRWTAPTSDWRIWPEPGSRENWPQAHLVAEAHHLGLAMAASWGPARGQGPLELHDEAIDAIGHELGGGRSPSQSHELRHSLGELPAISSRLTAGHEAVQVVTAASPDVTLTVAVHAEPLVLEERAELIAELVGGFALQRPDAVKGHADGAWWDHRFGFRIQRPASHCEIFDAEARDPDREGAAVLWNCSYGSITVLAKSYLDEVQARSRDHQAERLDSWLGTETLAWLGDVSPLAMDWYFSGQPASCLSYESDVQELVSCVVQEDALVYLIAARGLVGRGPDAADYLATVSLDERSAR